MFIEFVCLICSLITALHYVITERTNSMSGPPRLSRSNTGSSVSGYGFTAQAGSGHGGGSVSGGAGGGGGGGGGGGNPDHNNSFASLSQRSNSFGGNSDGNDPEDLARAYVQQAYEITQNEALKKQLAEVLESLGEGVIHTQKYDSMEVYKTVVALEDYLWKKVTPHHYICLLTYASNLLFFFFFFLKVISSDPRVFFLRSYRTRHFGSFHFIREKRFICGVNGITWYRGTAATIMQTKMTCAPRA
jgi:hypothetical protein